MFKWKCESKVKCVHMGLRFKTRRQNDVGEDKGQMSIKWIPVVLQSVIEVK